MANRAENLLSEANLKSQIKPLRERGIGAGAGIFLMAEYEHSRAGFGAVGKLGMPAEQVAAIATEDLLNFHTQDAPIDLHLADQLLLPMALANAPSQYRAADISLHLTTNAWTIEQFDLAKIAIDETSRSITVTPTH